MAGTVDVVLPIPVRGAVRPYVIGGVGYFQYRQTADAGAFGNQSLDDRDIGLNGGAGLRFRASSLDALVEARFHSIFGSLHRSTASTST